jgi:8-oxo-dGTP diphosphatase
MSESPSSAPSQATVVVGAAIARRGPDGPEILCARRSAPPALAGKWEFPGGKVEPGESDAEAIVRECREELGIEVAAGPLVGGEQPIDERFVLRIYRAEMLPGQPEPEALEDHDLLLWVRPGSLVDLDWLPADVPVVAALAGTNL